MTTAMEVPYINLAAQHAPMTARLLEAVTKVIDHGMFILGPEVEEFEGRFAELSGVQFVVGANSGTDTLDLAPKVFEIGSVYEVITVPNSFVSSADCIAMVEATSVFVDVLDDLNIDSNLVKAAITSQTNAILPVYLIGKPCHTSAIMEIAESHGLAVIEDAAQAASA